jgi:hypothetical protein
MAFYVWLRDGNDVYSGEPWPLPEEWSEPREVHVRDAKTWYAFRGHQIVQRIPANSPSTCQLWGVEVDGDYSTRDGEQHWQMVRLVKSYGGFPDSGWRQMAFPAYKLILDALMAHPGYYWGYGFETHAGLKKQLAEFREYTNGGERGSRLDKVCYPQLRYCMNLYEAQTADEGWNALATIAHFLKQEKTRFDLSKMLVERLLSDEVAMSEV